MHFFFFLLAFGSTQLEGDYQFHVIQLSSKETTVFRDWRLRVDDRELYTFGDNGVLKLTIPKDSVTFEVLDNRDAVRFFRSLGAVPGH